MTITQLKYFLALAETLNFSKVAERFYVAQTAISYGIKSLETELGTALFQRTTKKVELTPAGQTFYSRIKPAVQIIDQANFNIANDPQRLTLTVGCSRLCSGPTFYRAAEDFQRSNPQIRLQLLADEPELTLLNRLAMREIDLAIYMKAPYAFIPSETITREFCGPFTRKVICSTRHPFAAGQKGVPASELITEQMISYANLENTRRFLPSTVDDELEAQSINRTIVCADFHSMLDMIGANLGVACIPLLDDLSTESICSRNCLEPLAHFPTLGATYCADTSSERIREFIDTLFHALSVRFPEGHEKA